MVRKHRSTLLKGGVAIKGIIILLTIHLSLSNGETVYTCSGGSSLIAYTPSGLLNLSETSLSVDQANPCQLSIPQSLAVTGRSKLQVDIVSDDVLTGGQSNDCLFSVISEYARYCVGGAERTLTLNTLTSGINISYTPSSVAAPQFNIRFSVYEDPCVTQETVTTYPAVVRSSQLAEERCGLSLGVSEVDSIIIKALPPVYNQPNCVMTDAVKLKRVGGDGKLICKGVECLNTNFDVSKDGRNIRILYYPAANCTFTWKITALSVTDEQDICSITGNDLTLPHMNIISPGYGVGFPSSRLNCSIAITGFEAVIVTTKYLIMRKAICRTPAPQGNPCYCGDYVVINGQAVCKLPRRQIETLYLTNNLPLQLNLITQDMAINRQNGFALSYSGYKNSVDICSFNLSSQVELPLLIKSPGFPSNYTSNHTCQANINVSGERQLQIKVISFDVEQDNSCRYDYLSINGRKYCGNGSLIPSSFNVTNRLSLNFRSDSTKSSKGFYLHISAVSTNTIPTSGTPLKIDATTGARSTSPPREELSPTTEPDIIEITEFSVEVEEEEDAAVTDEIELTTKDTELIDPESSKELSLPRIEDTTVDLKANANSQTTVHRGSNVKGIVIKYSAAVPEETTTVGKDRSANGLLEACKEIPWYFWIGSLIAILLAVLITMTVFLIKLKRLKVALADGEGSRDGLANPIYYNQNGSTPPFPLHLNNNSSNHPYTYDDEVGGPTTSPHYNNWDRNPLSSFKGSNRRIINKNSTQTTV